MVYVFTILLLCFGLFTLRRGPGLLGGSAVVSASIECWYIFSVETVMPQAIRQIVVQSAVRLNRSKRLDLTLTGQ